MKRRMPQTLPQLAVRLRLRMFWKFHDIDRRSGRRGTTGFEGLAGWRIPQRCGLIRRRVTRFGDCPCDQPDLRAPNNSLALEDGAALAAPRVTSLCPRAADVCLSSEIDCCLRDRGLHRSRRGASGSHVTHSKRSGRRSPAGAPRRSCPGMRLELQVPTKRRPSSRIRGNGYSTPATARALSRRR